MKEKMPKLPSLLDRKIYKTGQTRGADDDVIFQNRVSRSSTVLIPYSVFDQAKTPPNGEAEFENGFIVLISPDDYFNSEGIDRRLKEKGLELGKNAAVFYETRAQWDANNPRKIKWKPAKQRASPIKGQYVARVPATTAAEGGNRIAEGFADTANKGAGIRVYEYASSKTIELCRLQLETIVWSCTDALNVLVKNGMDRDKAILRKETIAERCSELGLLDYFRLTKARIVNEGRKTICPLCLEELSAQGFFSRMEQAEGRDVPDITVTELNLFHIAELRAGKFNHRPYNIGWGHHHCNVVVKDSGILETVKWMKKIIAKNDYYETMASENKGS